MPHAGSTANDTSTATQGLEVERRFTEAGVDPFATVDFVVTEPAKENISRSSADQIISLSCTSNHVSPRSCVRQFGYSFPKVNNEI